jgi:threonine/homoserine/homoserine lactone efflux protein
MTRERDFSFRKVISRAFGASATITRGDLIFRVVILAGVAYLAGLQLWQAEVNAAAPQKPEYGITSNSYLPIQRLEPVY